MKKQRFTFLFAALLLTACFTPTSTPDKPSSAPTSSSTQPEERQLSFNFENSQGLGEEFPHILVPGLEIEIIAGTGTPGYLDGPGLKSQFNGPADLALTDAGALLIIDNENPRIRKLTPEDGQWITSTLVGTGEKGLQTGPGARAKMNYPLQLIRGEHEQYYLLDGNEFIFYFSLAHNELHLLLSENSTVDFFREKGNQIEDDFIPVKFFDPTRIDYHSPYLYYSADSTIYRLKDGERNPEPYMGYEGRAGSKFIDDVNSHFKDGPRQQAYLSDYVSLAFADNGDIYLTDNHRIRKYTAATDAITTLSGQIIPLDFANGIVYSRDGTLKEAWFKDLSDILYYSGQGQKDLLLICDEGRIRLMTDQYVTTLTEYSYIYSLAQADENTFYATDAKGSIYRIQMDIPLILKAMQDNPVRYYETGKDSAL